jgi:transglutaminase-like putative cysteine protease
MMMRKGSRIIVLLVWVVLLGLLFGRDYLVEDLQLWETAALERGRETSFAGVYFRDERIGFVRSRLVAEAEDEVLLEQEAYLLLNILGEQHPVRMRLSASLDASLLLRDFSFVLISPFAETGVQGRVEGRDLLLELDTPRGVRQERIRLRDGPRIATNRRDYLLSPDLTPGGRVRVNYFDPVSLAGQERVLEYRGRDRVVIHGRIHNLHQFSETFAGMRINVWLDDEGRMVKEESPAGFVFLAEPEFRATDIPRAGPEILTSVAVPLIGRLPADLARRDRMTYRLELAADAGLDPAEDLDLAGGRQSLEGDILQVSRQPWPPPAGAGPCSPEGPAAAAIRAALSATPHVQSDDPELIALARQITAGAASPPEAMARLADWVYAGLEKRPVLGIPDALSVLATRVGDCNEHAALFAGLARAIGLPTRIAAGLVFQDETFFYHAWNEVCLADQWYSVDTTLNELPAGLTHIRLVTGETAEMVRLGALLGKLRIAVATD